jgi:hypothetical protein
MILENNLKPVSTKYKIHFESNKEYIKSLGSLIKYNLDNYRGEFKIPERIPFFCANYKLLRRAFRLNRMNVKLLENDSLLIIRNSNLYVYDLQRKELLHKITFSFTKYVHSETIFVNKNNIVIGEYGNSDNNYSVGVHISNDCGRTWTRKELFKKNEVKNILAVKKDDFTDTYWVFTGDEEKHCKINIYNAKWKLVQKVGEKNMLFRAISSYFFKDKVVWLTNNPFGDSCVVIYDRNSTSFKVGQKFDGPIWYSVCVGENYFATTAAETQTGNSSKFVFLYHSTDCIHWKLLMKFEKDCYNKNIFLHGLISFTDHDSDSEYINLYFDAINKYDGKNYQLFLNKTTNRENS